MPLRVRAIILSDSGRILLGKHHNDSYDLIGGKIEEGEHPVDALLRELKEETGYSQFDSVEYLWFFEDSYVFLCVPKNKINGPSNTLDPDNEFKGLEWFDFCALPDLEDYSEDIIYHFLRKTILQQNDGEQATSISAGHIDVLIDGKKVYELADDMIWETLPRLAQERARGRKVEFKQILDDGTVVDQTANPMPVYSDMGVTNIDSIIDGLLVEYIPAEKARPIVELVSNASFLAKTVWRKKDGLPATIVVLVNTEILNNEDILRQVLAHEIIHVHLYSKFGKEVAKHGEHFNYLADKINQKEGKNYISQYADHTDFVAKD